MKKLLLFVILLGLFNCKTHLENTTAKPTKLKAVASTIISKGTLYGAGAEGIEAQNMIIKNQKDWDKLINQMNSVNTVSKGFTETTIDFSQRTIIAVFDQVKGNGGHGFELIVTSNSQNTTVDVTHVAQDGHATTAMTQPYVIVSIPKTDLPIVFQ